MKNAKILLLIFIAPVIIGVLLLTWLFDLPDVLMDMPDVYSTWGKTPAWRLALAVDTQNTAWITHVAKAHPDVLNYREPTDGYTVLIWAVGHEKYRSARALLHCGANPNIRDKMGETALYVAAGYSWVDDDAKKDPKYVKLLLRHGADPNIPYIGFGHNGNSYDAKEAGTTPLMHSIPCGLEKTKALVEGGADLNQKTVNGTTAAVVALTFGALNVTDAGREYAYYLIAVKKAKVTDPYNSVDLLTDPPKVFYPVDDLKDWNPEVGTKGYWMKMQIINEFRRQGVKY
ncbi:MAG TPA: ankyrin repeat domain-containing protein [Armatimonadota bacterium]|nr:ankyrin repeat domain-containing protein [Armatimonadota bacterium]